jgi:LEA14-like dessication related protein
MQIISDVTLAESAASEPIPVTGGTATLYVNNKKEGSGSIDKTQLI